MQRFELDASETLALKLTTSKLRQRLDWLDIEVVSLRDRAHLLQEEVTIKTAEQTNRNLQVLAIVTTIFLPATLVSGIFGMNVMGLPLTQNPHGFVWSMLIGACALAFEKIRDLRSLRLCVRGLHEPQIARNAPPYKAAWYLPAQKMIDAGERPDR